MLNDITEKNTSLKKNQENLGKSHKLGLIS